MSTQVMVEGRKQVARPLNVLVLLIKEDLKQAEQAAQNAGMPYYKAAGDKMLEAKEQMAHGEFKPWIVRNFLLSYSRAKQYMQFASAMSGKKTEIQSFSSLNDFHRQTGSSNYRSVTSKQGWHDAVKGNIERARRDAERLAQENLSRQQEREAEQKLALRLIDIGFKVLVKELHPDKGGSRDAMARLNRVRARLRNAI